MFLIIYILLLYLDRIWYKSKYFSVLNLKMKLSQNLFSKRDLDKLNNLKIRLVAKQLELPKSLSSYVNLK